MPKPGCIGAAGINRLCAKTARRPLQAALPGRRLDEVSSESASSWCGGASFGGQAYQPAFAAAEICSAYDFATSTIPWPWAGDAAASRTKMRKTINAMLTKLWMQSLIMGGPKMFCPRGLFGKRTS